MKETIFMLRPPVLSLSRLFIMQLLLSVLIGALPHRAVAQNSNCPIFPADNVWNTPIDTLPVHANSATYVNAIGATIGVHADFGTVWNGAPNGIPYTIVANTQQL